jgi:hypothetical protein
MLFISISKNGKLELDYLHYNSWPSKRRIRGTIGQYN